MPPANTSVSSPPNAAAQAPIHFLGPVPVIGFQIPERISVKDRAGLDCFAIQRTVQVPARFQFPGYAVLQSNVLVETFDRSDPLRHRAIALEPGGHAVIGQLGAIAHRRAINVRTLKRSIFRKNHFNGDGQAV